jgi:hypothetical protein
MRRFGSSALAFCLALTALPQPELAAKPRKRERPAYKVIQPAKGGQDLVVLSAPGRARVKQSGEGTKRVRLRRNEKLSDLAEVSRGWVAAGVREEADRTELLILRQSSAGLERIPPPPLERGMVRLRPVLLVHRDRLVGAAWLEGRDFRHLVGKMADWEGVDWGPVVTVGLATSGSQTGLTGTVLANGSVLLLWSQFDGQDDEIYWSLRSGADFSTPERLGEPNHLPDITPVVTSTSRGAVAAWSRYDGRDYRLVTSRFHQTGWERPRIVGEAGALYPQLLHARDELFVTYRNASPQGWTVRQIDSRSGPKRNAFVPWTGPERPVVRNLDRQSVTFSWPQLRRRQKIAWKNSP